MTGLLLILHKCHQWFHGFELKYQNSPLHITIWYTIDVYSLNRRVQPKLIDIKFHHRDKECGDRRVISSGGVTITQWGGGQCIQCTGDIDFIELSSVPWGISDFRLKVNIRWFIDSSFNPGRKELEHGRSKDKTFWLFWVLRIKSKILNNFRQAK